MERQTQATARGLPLWIIRLWNGISRVWGRVFLRGDFTALLLASGMLLTAALAMRATGWTEGLIQLVPVSLLGVFFGFLLARSHYGELLSLLISSVYSLGFIGLLTALFLEEGSLFARLGGVFARSVAWLQVLSGEGIAQDNLVFVLFLSILFWFLGHNTAWHIFRVDRVWRAVIPPGLVILVNEFYDPGETPVGPYLAVFGVFALLLLVRSAIDGQEWEWYLKRITFPPGLRTRFMRWGAVVAIVLVGVAWALPSGENTDSLERVQEFLNSDPLAKLNQLFNRLFASLDSEGLVTADYYGGNSLQLSGAIQLGDRPVMLVAAPPLDEYGTRYYWRSRTFSHYESGRWTPSALVRLTVPEAGFTIQDRPAVQALRESIQQQVTVVIDAARLVYSAPQPSVLNLPVTIDLSYVDEARQMMDVSVIRPLEVLRNGDSYTVISHVSVADAPSLRTAGTVYPAWVLDTYLQLGGSVTTRTRELAFAIVGEANALTPYDQAKAIERWLRANIVYDETIPAPPPGVDAVDWVLFDGRRGYCNYYASAMVVLLRAVGVPARLAAGFSQGEWSTAPQQFLVRERDAHTWVEVYFPDYGWVEFEPTAAQAPLDRPDVIPMAPGALQATSTPVATSTPWPTLTPTVTPSPEPTATPSREEAAPYVPPTITPPPTPTLSAPPTPVPPPEEEIRTTDRLSAILSVVVTILIVIGLVILLAVLILFLIWWLEWRGLGGLTPVQRAYALLERYAGYLGVRLAPSYTPHERQRVISHHVPESKQAVHVITDLYVEETYGPQQQRRTRWNIVARNALDEARKAFLRARVARLLPRRWRGD